MSRPWMPLYVADFVADTMHLSRQNRGSYMSLICHYWRHGGLPNDLALLQQIAGTTPEEWNIDGAVLASFFTITNKGWIHKRIEKELQDAENKYERRRASGKLGGQKKASNASSNARAKSYQPQPQPHIDTDPKGSVLAASQPNAKRKSVKTAIAEDQEPTAKDEVFAGDAGMTFRQIDEEWDQFRDHHRKLGNRMADWPAAWRTWVRNWKKFRARAGPTGRSNGTAGAIRAFLEEGENDDRTRRQESTGQVIPMLSADRRRD